MKVKKTKSGNYKIKASAEEAKFLHYLAGNSDSIEAVKAGVVGNIPYDIYDTLNGTVDR